MSQFIQDIIPFLTSYESLSHKCNEKFQVGRKEVVHLKLLCIKYHFTVNS